jgi:two-component system nitrate/nitrite response regulator NarL
MKDMHMTSILLVDDHLLFREGLRGIIEHWEDFEIVGEASNGREALEAVRKNLPDLVLMDITMPEMNGLEATRRIVREYPSTHVVMLTVSEEQEDLFDAIKVGAQGYVLKDMPSRRLHDLLRGIIRGESALSGAVATKILAEFSEKVTPKVRAGTEDLDPLSERENQVLGLLAEGLSNREIAERLVLSENTVKKHVKNILQKLHVNNRVQAAIYAKHEGVDRE